MFIRYSLTATADDIGQRFALEVPKGYEPQYNASPTHLLPVITDDSQKGLSFFYWGTTPLMANQKSLGEKIINTKAESIREKQVARKKFKERRCLIPADGFYEWKKTGKRTSIPYRFTLQDKSMFALAGLWEEYDDEHGEMFHTFSIITTPASETVAVITERMPLVLPAEMEKSWLDGTDEQSLIALLQPYAGALDFYSVSSRVNFPERNDRLVILPAPPADQFGNLELFD